jgi:hypothetical protein
MVAGQSLDSDEEMHMMQHYIVYFKNSNMSSTDEDERMSLRTCADHMLLASYKLYQKHQQRQQRLYYTQ